MAAALIGVLAAVGALAAGHLVAGLLEPSSSPYLAVGNTAIDLTPEPVKAFAIEQFGENDKIVLLLGMGVVILLLAAVAGLLSRRSPVPGLIVIGVFGAVGIAAALARPTLGVLGLVAPVVAALAGLATFWWLHRKAPRPEVADDEDAEQADSSGGSGRRRFLITSGAVTAGVAASGAVGQLLIGSRGAEQSRRAIGRIVPARKAPPIPAGADFTGAGTPPFLTPNPDFYRVDTALRVPRLPTDGYRLRVHGMVERELNLSYDDLMGRPLVEKTITMTCVSNQVGGPYVSTSNFVGVPIRDILNEAGVRPGAEQVFSTSVDGYTAGTPVEVLLERDRDALIALGMNGEPLPLEHGFPVRMVTPGLYGYLSATKWLVDLELTTFDKVTYWEERGWAERAPIKTQSRIDRPGAFQKLPAGRTTAAGIAWAQQTGIERVEVRVDSGPWQEAELSTQVGVDTWRMWRIELDLEPGGHNIECRATDRSGYTQTSDRVPPIPDGATGWHSIFCTAQ
ncbi:molybdopterin-dependent oxidoreductase [Amycolatopsis cihanbeyliensis]|uniref:DMSO/TMAO reductase YedYZ molybdopterin-dependent catalytic subunit n=1 Tax=Amycolatopsis cihanbeyliensis TaxID=1128664 RepID=A0A542DHU5_AMYCI|nr:molybdopterin-dependent oxidoreductase [Amycolatopsis cihanbeyliensis]TQJ02661.1 DMSO/TMAO reductase YedYZ molybdopterin-dependent catalytic subunit [Amycolatopsis cihanbeyliensis]